MNNFTRYNFFDVFQENPDGSLSPTRTIIVNGISFNPGVSFGQGVSFGGVDFHDYKYHGIAGEERDGVLIIRGFYNPRQD